MKHVLVWDDERLVRDFADHGGMLSGDDLVAAIHSIFPLCHIQY